ncbi:uncharacterized protein [Primulina huaijiensis]|uniref:uncharacterized protein n=1 Tax=Primulina huaijiensis TaxID=1492673 RepID=UPI003CC727A1
MKALFIFTGFLFLAVLARNALARKDPGEYWKHVMKDEPMPEYIQGLVGASEVTCTDNKNKGYFHISSQKTSIDPIPSVTAYTDDVKPEKYKYFVKDQLKPRSDTPVYRNSRHFHISPEKTSFDPFPSATAYADDVKPKNDQRFTKEFEPSPNVSAYTDDVEPQGEKMFTKEFEPIPNVSAYTDDVKPEGEKMFTKEFEPSPNVSAYNDGIIELKAEN